MILYFAVAHKPQVEEAEEADAAKKMSAKGRGKGAKAPAAARRVVKRDDEDDDDDDFDEEGI